MHFADKMQIVIRRTPEEFLETLADVALAARQFSN
jgi:hypothetical protein